MSRKKSRRTTPAEPEQRVHWPRGRWLLGAGGTVAATAIAVILYWSAHRSATTPMPLPPPTQSVPPAGPTFQDFVGAETCGQCHREEYAAWKGSTHGRAGGPPTKERVIAPFNGVPMRFKDALVTPSVTRRGDYVFTVAQKNHPTQVLRVAHVVGGGFMAGGGTQAFFAQFPDGTSRFLPFDFSKAENGWFCNTIGRANHASVLITAEVAIADCGDWPPNRVLGSTDRYQGCQQCHGSQIELTFDSSSRRYDTRFTTLAINCESCHGPGQRHVALARSGRIGESEDIGMRPLATFSKDQSIAVCFQCHAVKASLEPGYLPGKPLERHFALKLPLLLDTLYFPDGRTREFAYQEGHLSSDCYLNGSMTCVDCHDPHTQRYRNVDGVPLQGRFDNGQCLDCHPSKAQPIERHTHHPAASSGSLCVSCHMPYLQEPSVGPHIRYARSDHTIPIPRPAYDNRLGIESACQQCHRDQAVEKLGEQVTRWYGLLKPHAAPVGALLAADSLAEPRAAARRILAASDRAAMADVSRLTTVMLRYAAPDLPVLDREVSDRLEEFAKEPDPDVQALALATLHLIRGADPPARRFLSRQLETLGPRDGAIRDRWIWILKVRGDAYLNRGDFPNAVAAYSKAREIGPRDPSILRSLGVAYTRLRDFGKAVERLRQSLALNPSQPQVLVELGFALMQQGDLDGATTAYQQAIAITPWDPSAHANLGIVYLRRGVVQHAIDALEKAVALDPGLAGANFALASAYATSGKRELALATLERGLEFDPKNAAARRMLDALQRSGPSTVR